MASRWKTFEEMAGNLHDLMEVQQLLEWDQQVTMPRKGGAQRALQQAAMARVVHERLTDRRWVELLAELEGEAATEEQAADLREARRMTDRACKLPASLVAARAEAVSLAQGAWEEAKPRGDFAAFLPHLERVLHLTREAALCLDAGAPYDALLEDFEPGMTEGELQRVFADLKGRLRPFLDRLLGAPHPPDGSVMGRRYPVAAQETLCRVLAEEVGFDFEAGRLDRSAHPFTNGTFRDVRITTRYNERKLNTALFGTLHEAGHALYEQGLDPKRYRMPAGQACSLGIHESQSRFWENVVGRSRGFWARTLPRLQETFPGVVDDVDAEVFFRAANVVNPSLIRVEADEVTYNLHIVLRFELESALLRGDLKPADLPGAWNERTKGLLGLVPPTDREGVLQDVHWSAGLVGYFPTYALGNLYAAQFAQAMEGDLGPLEERAARGDFGSLREWLREKIHRHGRKDLAPELCRKVTGKALSAEPLMTYLERKFGAVYGL